VRGRERKERWRGEGGVGIVGKEKMEGGKGRAGERSSK